MTDHTTAAHAAMQESERVTAADEYFKARTWIMDTNDNRRIFEAGFDRAYALLSKLRAPVAGNQPYPAMPEPDVTNPGEQEDSYSQSAMKAAMRSAHDRGYSVGWDHGKEHSSAPVADERSLAVALRAIAEYPTPGEGSMSAANMREIARSALVGAPISGKRPPAPTAPPSLPYREVESGVINQRCREPASAPVAGEAQWPFPTPGTLCRGSVALGSGCGICERCIKEKARLRAGDPKNAAPQASEADDLIDALGKCRDAFPIPDKVGSKLDLLWQEAMSDPTAVPKYVKLCAALSAQPGAQKEGGSDAN